MARAIILNKYPKCLKISEPFIRLLADSAKAEMGQGISNKALIDVYKRTYGRYIARRVFRLIGL